MPRTPNATPIYHGRRWPVGIHNAAKRLNITANHLRHVLTGERVSERVFSGYSALCVELTGKPFTQPKAKRAA